MHCGVQLCAEGQIQSEISSLRALEKDEYNYITATYFLLAERLLRKERQAQAEKLTTMHSSSDSKLQLASLALSPRYCFYLPNCMYRVGAYMRRLSYFHFINESSFRIREKFSGDENAVCTCSDPSENCLW